RKRAQVTEPFDPKKLLQKSGEMPFRRDVPRHKERDEDQRVGPVKKFFESQARFPMHNGKQNENCERIEEPKQTFGQTRKRAANPKSKEPKRAAASPMITAHSAKNCAGDECAEDRLGHDHPSEN